MRGKFSIIIPLAAALFMGSGPLLGHHGNAAYDSTKSITMKGTVTEWWWANPHCLLMYDVKGEDAKVVHWIVETQAPINMIPAGWSKESFKSGDEVTVTVEPAKNGNPIGRIRRVVLPSGKALMGQNEFKEDDYKPRP